MQYKIGTCTVTNGSAVITFSGTALTGYVQVGDLFWTAGSGILPTPIASVDSDTQITLTAAWAGPTATGITYRIFTGDTTDNGLALLQEGTGGWMKLFNRNMWLLDDWLFGGDGSGLMAPVLCWTFWEDIESWTASNATFTYQAGTTYSRYASTAAAAHYIQSPSFNGFDPDRVNQFRLRYRYVSGTTGATATLYWYNGSWYSKTLTLSYDGDWHTILQDMSGEANWTGADVTQVKLYMPVDSISGCTWDIDHIAFGTKGIGLGHGHMTYETFQGAQTAADGLVIYDTAKEFLPGTLRVIYAGQEQRNGVDYTEATNRATTKNRHGFLPVTFTPASGETMWWGYAYPQ